jgi:hypothetical protein
MAASTIYSIQKMSSLDPGFHSDLMKNYKNLAPLVKEDVQFLDMYYPPALKLIPEKYQSYVKSRLLSFDLEFDETKLLENFQLYD